MFLSCLITWIVYLHIYMVFQHHSTQLSANGNDQIRLTVIDSDETSVRWIILLTVTDVISVDAIAR